MRPPIGKRTAENRNANTEFMDNIEAGNNLSPQIGLLEWISTPRGLELSRIFFRPFEDRLHSMGLYFRKPLGCVFYTGEFYRRILDLGKEEIRLLFECDEDSAEEAVSYFKRFKVIIFSVYKEVKDGFLGTLRRYPEEILGEKLLSKGIHAYGLLSEEIIGSSSRWKWYPQIVPSSYENAQEGENVQDESAEISRKEYSLPSKGNLRMNDEDAVFDLQILRYRIEEMISSCSRIVRNSVSQFLGRNGCEIRLFMDTVLEEGFSPLDIPGIGKRSLKETSSLIAKMKELVMRHVSFGDPLYMGVFPDEFEDMKYDPSWEKRLGRKGAGKSSAPLFPKNIEEALPLLRLRSGRLSPQASRVIGILTEEGGNSVLGLHDYLMTPSRPLPGEKDPWFFSLIGTDRKIGHEVLGFLSEIVYFSGIRGEEKVRKAVEDFCLMDLLPDEKKRKEALELERVNGCFPVFFLLKELFKAKDGEDASILENCIRYRRNQKTVTLSQYADKTGRTVGAVHQRRKRVLASIGGDFRRVREFLPDKRCGYIFSEDGFERNVNALEGTDFGEDFVKWAIASIFEEYVLVGDPATVLSKSRSKAKFLILVPKELMVMYDFGGFIERTGMKIEEKRTDDVAVPFADLFSGCLLEGNEEKAGKEKEEKIEVAEKICRWILEKGFGLERKCNDGMCDGLAFVFRANSYKKMPDMIHELIVKNGAPLTERQLSRRLKKEYPDRKFSKGALGINALKHPDIERLPGHPGTYTLRGWMESVPRKGSIREFVKEYLDSQQIPIASLQSIGDYVRRFRPTASDRSIAENLLREVNRTFAAFDKDGERYLGYREVEYPKEYEIRERSIRTKG